MSEVKENLFYTKEHDWVRVEGNKAYVGLSDYAQHHLGSIVYAEAPEIDDEFAAGDAYGVVESVKAASDLTMPVAGKVVEVNEEVIDSPELINEAPWENWLIAIEMENEEAVNELMNAEAYQKFLDEEEK